MWHEFQFRSHETNKIYINALWKSPKLFWRIVHFSYNFEDVWIEPRFHFEIIVLFKCVAQSERFNVTERKTFSVVSFLICNDFKSSNHRWHGEYKKKTNTQRLCSMLWNVIYLLSTRTKTRFDYTCIYYRNSDIQSVKLNT